ncbi:beta-ribofuranosylaminobenzene 5'-phosphate synthase family protein [Aureimonas fodinaquatilis]|uniref:beta-ribofuranosylaminobenzene 5'-phosphate synthase family protein n=1 Tax=Aureimonas fodinaquatilis TaxID=2565783 RepID=UPI001FE6548A|nr:beta-ribofuranosylaminobenzene 5'-phosphate synthase family protein [Aureimonas fodinaquatilis]
MKTQVVRVTAPARLHLGFLDLNGGLGRKFGGIGLALAEPQTRLTLKFSEHGRTQVTGSQANRAENYLTKMAASLQLEGAYALHVEEALPAHAGLGSGTQMALSVAQALRRLHHLPLNAAEDAMVLERGARSGLGAAFFRTGGLLVDGGRGPDTRLPPIIAAQDFPSDWRVILVLDHGSTGVHGAKEIAAFATLPRFPESAAQTICRLTLMQLLPALAEQDIAAFGSAVFDIQRLAGAYFAPAQGGVFASARVAQTMGRLDALGAFGSGQSSWGPTGFAFAPSQKIAQNWVDTLLRESHAENLEIRIVSGRSSGASVETLPQLTPA